MVTYTIRASDPGGQQPKDRPWWRRFHFERCYIPIGFFRGGWISSFGGRNWYVSWVWYPNDAYNGGQRQTIFRIDLWLNQYWLPRQLAVQIWNLKPTIRLY